MSASLQRQLTPNFVVEGSYIGKIGKKLVGHNFFNAAPFINSPVTGQPPSLQNVEERVPFSPGIISTASRVLGNFFRSEYHSLQLRAERRMARSFSLSASYALSKNLTNQPENTTGLISNIPNPFDLDSLWGPSYSRPPARGCGVVGVESAARLLECRLECVAERMDGDRIPSHPVGQSVGVHDGRRRRAERRAECRRTVSRAGVRSDRRRPADGIFPAPRT